MGMCMLSNSNVLGESDYCFAFVKDYHHGKYVLDCPKPLWNSWSMKIIFDKSKTII